MTPFHLIGHDIKVALDNGAPTAAIILTYAAIDAMAYLSMPECQENATRIDFIRWVEVYMKTDSKQPYQYRGIDLYGARCGLMHRYGATSDLSDKGQCKVFNYHNGADHIYNPAIEESLVAVSWNRLIKDFSQAMQDYLSDVINDPKLKKLVDIRIGNLFFVEPISLGKGFNRQK